MEEVKSKLQVGLESRGWKFLTNDNPDFDLDIGDILYGDMELVPRLNPKSDEELRNEYLMSKNFNQVMITDAYDIHGNLLSYLRGVYVKR